MILATLALALATEWVFQTLFFASSQGLGGFYAGGLPQWLQVW